MKKLTCVGIFLSMLFLTTLAMAEQITYNIGWIASGAYAFQDAAFRMSLTGDTANAFEDSLGNTINQGMTGTLYLTTWVTNDPHRPISWHTTRHKSPR